jgi:hypothetical protein
VAVPLTNAQKYRRGLLPQLTSPGDTRIRYPQPQAQPKVPRSTTAGLQPYTGYEGPGVQDYINQGTIQWNKGLGNIGYTQPQINLGGGGGGPGGAGGYAGMIGGDYGVQEMESMMNARMGRARGDFQGQLRQALVDLGLTDTSKLGSLGSYIDSDTISKAAENKYSQVAKISQAETARRAQSEADLAARGMLGSGQLTTNAENILAEGESARYGALRDFLGAGQQGLTQLADLNDQQAMALSQARFDAAARAAETYQYGMADPYGYGPDTTQYAAPAAFSSGPLSQRAWLAKHPGGQYQNYLRAFQRHQRQGY